MKKQQSEILTVCVFCYNQKEFIKQCLDSIVGQQTNFDFSILVGDDCSTDGTKEICIEFQQKYPDKISLVLNEKNVGLMHNYVNILNHVSTKYVALCAGDDYWCDTNKLQKQVSFLENNQEYVMCFTNAYKEYYKMQNQEREIFANIANREYQGNEIIIDWTIPASSVVLRKDKFEPSFLLKREYYAEDLATYLKLAEVGKLYGMSDITTIYRIHESSITAKKMSSKEWIYRYETTLKSIDKELNRKYRKTICEDLSITYYQTGKNEFKRGSKFLSLRFLFISCCKKIESVF
ncbi:MAG: glycosyltransferase [Paludibacteraceae bacterium]|nr:glycosyltransferase [Paludibacteraceae bacterium]